MLRITSCPITRCVSIWFRICCLKSSYVMPGVVADELLELVGIGDLLLHLDFGQAAGYVGIDIDVEILGFLHQQQGVDLVHQQAGSILFERRVEAWAGEALRFDFGFEFETSSWPGLRG